MQSNTSPSLSEKEVVTSLAAHFASLTDNRKPRGVRARSHSAAGLNRVGEGLRSEQSTGDGEVDRISWGVAARGIGVELGTDAASFDLPPRVALRH